MPNDLMTPISVNLKRLREAAKLTQQQLAFGAGMSVSIVSQIEQGSSANPRASTLNALARVLGVTVDDLLRPPHETEAVDQPAEEKKPAPKKGRRRKG